MFWGVDTPCLHAKYYQIINEWNVNTTLTKVDLSFRVKNLLILKHNNKN